MQTEERAAAAAREHEQELLRGERFEFGENWRRFLRLLDEERIQEAIVSLQVMLEVEGLAGKSFLDVGSGSGLFSLAARRLGARVFSFDYDPKSVACTRELKRRYFEHDESWRIEIGSVLDSVYLSRLGKFDIVYSWGVLHHTGAMSTALANIDANVESHGKLFLAIYNYQPLATRYWAAVKKLYNRQPFSRPLLLLMHLLYPTLPSLLIRLVQGRKPPRGMNTWYDLQDWLGGYPFEAAKPEQILAFYKKRGYRLEALKTAGGRHGCNEFVFQRSAWEEVRAD